MQFFMIVNVVYKFPFALSLVGRAGGGFGSGVVLVSWLCLE